MMTAIIALQILLWNEGYNLFADWGTLLVIVTVLVICGIVHAATYGTGKLFKVWKIPKSDQFRNEDDEKEQQSEDWLKTIMNLKEKEAEHPEAGRFAFLPQRWNKISKAIEEEYLIKVDLQTDRFKNQVFREMFMKYNKPWLAKEGMHELFTPRTEQEHRREILAKFKQIHGDIEEKESSESESSSWSSSGEGAELEAGVRTSLQLENLKTQIQGMNQSAMGILHLWQQRAALRVKIRRQVTRIINQNLKMDCKFCSSVFGLRCQVINDIEAIFHNFLREKGMDKENYESIEWMRYFRKHATFRTLCLNCAEEIQDHNMQIMTREKERKKQLEEKQRIMEAQELSEDEDEEDAETYFESTIELEIAQSSRGILLMWLGLARNILHNK